MLINQKKINSVLLFLLIFFLSIPIIYSGTPHAVFGEVKDSLDGTSANGATVVMYIEGREAEILSDIVGPSGSAGTDNWYSIDVGNFPTPWSAGEKVIINIEKDSYHKVSTSVVLTSGGSDQAPTTILPGSAPSTSTGSSGGGGGYAPFVIDFRTQQEYPTVYLSLITPVTMILSDGTVFYVYYYNENSQVKIKITKSLQYSSQTFEEGYDLNKEIQLSLNKPLQLNLVDGEQKEIEVEQISNEPVKFSFKELNETTQQETQSQEQTTDINSQQEPETQPQPPVKPQPPKESETQQKEPQSQEQESSFVSFLKTNYKRILGIILLIIVLIIIFESILRAKKHFKSNKQKQQQTKTIISQQTTQQQPAQPVQQPVQQPAQPQQVQQPSQKQKLFQQVQQPTSQKPQPTKLQLQQTQKQPSTNPQVRQPQKPQQEQKPKKQNLFKRLTQTMKKDETSIKTKIENTEFFEKLKKIEDDELKLNKINKKLKELDKKLK